MRQAGIMNARFAPYPIVTARWGARSNPAGDNEKPQWFHRV